MDLGVFGFIAMASKGSWFSDCLTFSDTLATFDSLSLKGILDSGKVKSEALRTYDVNSKRTQHFKEQFVGVGPPMGTLKWRPEEGPNDLKTSAK